MATVQGEELEPEVVEAEMATPAMSGTEKLGPAAAQTDELQSPIDETAVPAPAVSEIAGPELPLSTSEEAGAMAAEPGDLSSAAPLADDVEEPAALEADGQESAPS